MTVEASLSVAVRVAAAVPPPVPAVLRAAFAKLLTGAAVASQVPPVERTVVEGKAHLQYDN